MTMVRTDYENVGRVLREVLHDDVNFRFRLADALATKFEERDPKFSRTKFFKSAAVFACQRCRYVSATKSGWYYHYYGTHTGV